MTRIFLIGYMGAGKTTLGKAFAQAMRLDFIDLDWYIEGRYHRTVRQLFSELGETGFREIERAMLHEVGEFEDVVIATGGGAPCFYDNLDYMNAQGQTVFLDVDLDTLHRRLRAAKQQRPMLKDKTDDELRDFIVRSLRDRMCFYGRAAYRIDGGRLESRQQVADSVARLKALLEQPPAENEKLEPNDAS